MPKSRSFAQQEVSTLLKTAQRALRSPLFDLLRSPKSLELARLLVITPARVGTAPQRNKIRRQLKAIFHENNLEKGSYDYIVIIKKIDPSRSFLDLQTIFLEGVSRA